MRRSPAGTAAPRAVRPRCWARVPSLFLPACAVHRQGDWRGTHACVRTRTRTEPHAHDAPPPSGAHASHSPASSYGRRSLFSPFSFLIISVCSSLRPFFQYPLFFLCTCSRLLHAAPTFPRPLLSPPSLSLSLRPSLPPCLPPSLLLTLVSVCRARGHYLSHSGHVRWNGGECSEQKQRELWGIVASGGGLGNSAALSPRENLHAL